MSAPARRARASVALRRLRATGRLPPIRLVPAMAAVTDAGDPSYRCWTGCPTSDRRCRFWTLCRPIADPPQPEPETKETQRR